VSGDVIEVITPGAGGYGAPSLRDKAAVERDISEGRIDRASASEVYRAD